MPDYNSSSFGLFVYLLLCAISIAAFSITPLSTAVIGGMSALWGGLVLLRLLSLYEVSEHAPQSGDKRQISKLSNHLTSALAFDISHRRHQNTQVKKSALAMQSLRLRNAAAFFLLFFYAIGILYSDDLLGFAVPPLEQICLFFILGSVFWMAQSYAYNIKVRRVLGVLFAMLLIISLVLHAQIALWICVSGIASVLWAACFDRRKVQYVLYQCQ